MKFYRKFLLFSSSPTTIRRRLRENASRDCALCSSYGIRNWIGEGKDVFKISRFWLGRRHDTVSCVSNATDERLIKNVSKWTRPRYNIVEFGKFKNSHLKFSPSFPNHQLRNNEPIPSWAYSFLISRYSQNSDGDVGRLGRGSWISLFCVFCFRSHHTMMRFENCWNDNP